MLKAIIMAGGKGERLNEVEKPMLKICNEPVIEHVTRVAEEVAEEVYIAISPFTTKTARWCLHKGYKVLETEGCGYSKDLKKVIELVGFPSLILPADTPFLTSNIIKRFMRNASEKKAYVITLVVNRSCFPKSLKGPDSPIGISLIKGHGTSYDNVRMCKYPELLDIDTQHEIKEALKVCREMRI